MAARSGAVAVTLVLLLLVVPAAMAKGVAVEGIATATSLRSDESAPVNGGAYLFGFRTDQSDESPYSWSFEAEAVSVSVTTSHRVSGGAEVDRTTRTTDHADASGILLKREVISHMMVVSDSPDDQAAVFRMGLTLPPVGLAASGQIDFDTKVELDEEEPIPVVGPIYEEHAAGASSSPTFSFNQPWPNLELHLRDHKDPITLSGDFTIKVYDMVFQVRNGTGETTTYDATYGGWRGVDTDRPQQTQDPPVEYNDTVAELHFTNATFTFRPEGRPVQINLRAAGMDATGNLLLKGVEGSLNASTDLKTSIDGTQVELTAEDLHLDLHPVTQSEDSAPELAIAFAGTLSEAAVDGRSLDLRPEGPEAVEPEATVTPTTAGGGSWPGAWWLLPLLAVLTVVSLVGAKGWRSRQARVDPEYVIHKGEIAFETGRINRAQAHASSVLRYHPHNQEAVALKAMLHIHRKQHDETMAFLKPYLLSPANEDGVLSIIYCVALRCAEGKERARDFLKEAVKQRPTIVRLARDFPQLDFEDILPPEAYRVEDNQGTFI